MAEKGWKQPKAADGSQERLESSKDSQEQPEAALTARKSDDSHKRLAAGNN